MITTAGHTIKEIRLRGKIIGKVMQGDKVVYQRSRLDTTPSLSFAAAGGSQVLPIDCAAGQAWTLSGIPAGWSASAASGTGPAEVTITAPNNTSTQAVAGTITVASGDKTATCTLSQAAGAKIYGDVVVGTYSYGVIPAGGGAVSPSLAYSQPWTWNGVSGSGGTVTSGGVISYSGSGVNSSTGAVSAASKGTSVSGQTTVTTATATVTMNGKSAAKSATVYQAANAATTITYGTPSVSLAVADIPAAGGSVASGTVTYSQSRTQNYTSGSTAALSALTTGGTVSYSATVSAPSLGTTVKARASVGNLNVTVTMNGKVGVGSAPVYQAANAVTGYSDIAIHVVVYNAIPYTGGTVAPSIVAAHTKNFSSGASATEESGFPPGYYLNFTISGSVFSIDSRTGSVSVGANASTASRSGLIAVTIKDPNGTQVAAKSATVKQEAKPGPVTVTLSVSVSGGEVQLKINPRTYDALSVHLMGYDTVGNVWSEIRNIGVGVASDPFYPKEALSGFATDATIESVNNGSLSPYTTENAIYRWGENTFE